MPEQTGLVLSGGGARGIAHIGVIKAIQDCRIQIHAVAGTSIGALIGALFAAGVDPMKILPELKQTKIYGPGNVAWKKSGLFQMDPIRKLLQKYLPETFEELNMPLYVTRSNLVTGKAQVVNSGLLMPALLSSACIPMVFQPVDDQNALWVDGGVTDNFPVNSVSHCKVIIGSHVNKLSAQPDPATWSAMRIFEQCFHIAINREITKLKNKCTFFIEPELFHYSMFDTKKYMDIFNIGYDHAISVLNETSNTEPG